MCQLKGNQAAQTSVLLRTVQKRYLNCSNREIRSLQVEKNKLDKPFAILSKDCKTGYQGDAKLPCSVRGGDDA